MTRGKGEEEMMASVAGVLARIDASPEMADVKLEKACWLCRAERTSGPAFQLHDWLMEGNVVREVVGVHDFHAVSFDQSMRPIEPEALTVAVAERRAAGWWIIGEPRPEAPTLHSQEERHG